MEALIAQLQSLAGESDEAGRIDIQNALRQLLSEIASPKDIRMGLFNSHLQIATVRLATEAGIFQTLSQSKEALTFSQIAEKSTASPELFERILRYLASNNMVTETGPGTYKANETSHALADPSAKAFAEYAFDQAGPIIQAYPSFFAETKYQDITQDNNTPFQKAFNTKLNNFAWLAEHPEHFAALQKMMSALGSSDWTAGFNSFDRATKAVTGSRQGSERPFFVDVGGGYGHQCIQLRNKYPNLAGWLVLQDLPRAVEDLPKIDGVESISHDFFQAQPVPGARFYYLRRILHDWLDAQCIQILNNLAAAMTSGSQILVDEMVVPETKVPWQVTVADLILMNSLGGKERTKAQWEALAEQAGLRVVEIHGYDPTTYFSVIVFERK
ncbi:S-adenosyl-L-methionine-dependent methyltransferase [Aspergillus avenaceus]|uniref:S-adenosyl-L-methionine-dependent methyltransferase n=1 Tax=Aspergillus avenaceus TaxID=36643 RepID=A0A5N6U344_ASPAV|nr:S-adenosyl-L-methionine-dependent methyltransferase [Aspergillus avenaceus]